MECSVCGNTYHRTIRILSEDRGEQVFDCFECAIHALAPTCSNCGTRVIGHGVETSDGTIFCCAHCARQQGHTGMADQQPESAVSGAGMKHEPDSDMESAVSGSGQPPQ